MLYDTPYQTTTLSFVLSYLNIPTLCFKPTSHLSNSLVYKCISFFLITHLILMNLNYVVSSSPSPWLESQYCTYQIVILFSITNVHPNSPFGYWGYFSYQTVEFHHADDESTNEFTPPNYRSPISSVLVISYHTSVGVSYAISGWYLRFPVTHRLHRLTWKGSCNWQELYCASWKR